MFLFCYGGDHGTIARNAIVSRVILVDIKAGVMFEEHHYGPVELVDMQSGFVGRVHGDATDLTDLRK